MLHMIKLCSICVLSQISFMHVGDHTIGISPIRSNLLLKCSDFSLSVAMKPTRARNDVMEGAALMLDLEEFARQKSRP